MRTRIKGRMQGAGVLTALLVLQLCMHLNADHLLLDDWVFYDAATGGADVLAFLMQRWRSWSSRLLIEGLLTLTTRSIWLWRVCDCAMMVLLAYALCRLAACEERPEMLAMAGLLVTSIPFAILRSTGWQATSLNYYWPLACAMAAMIPLADALWKRPASRMWRFAALPCALLGANQEQTAAALVGAHLVLGAALLIRDRKIPRAAVGVFVLALVQLCMHLLCPGNALRAQQSVALVNLRDYGQFALVDKLSIGLTSTTALLLFTWCPMLIACGGCVLASAVARRRHPAYLLLTALPLCFALFAVYVPQLLASVDGLQAALEPFQAFGTYTLMLGPQHAADPRYAGMMCAIVAVLGLMALSLYLSIGHRPRALAAVFAFALGFAARMALAFSPTVVESGERTMLPLYGAMMLCALLCLRDAPEQSGWLKPVNAARFLCALLAAANLAGSFALAA